MQDNPTILLSFDVEEFDLPAEYNIFVSIEKQLTTGYEGFLQMEALLTGFNLPATLYTTAFFAENYPADIKRLGLLHEVASHTYFHNILKPGDLEASRKCLENITGKTVSGVRMPRMQQIAAKDVLAAGYRYNSSLNPTCIPGRYNHLFASRTVYQDAGLTILPLSVSPNLRLPLFWLAFKNLPYRLFLKVALQTLRHDGSLHLYFHPWEFTNLKEFKIPFYIKRQDGDVLLKKMQWLIKDLSSEGDFTTTSAFLEKQKLQ